MKKYKKKTRIVYSWDRAAERIDIEKGITLYKHQQFDDKDKKPYPRYKYKVTFELIKITNYLNYRKKYKKKRRIK